MNIIQQLILHEGIRLKPYRCPAGRLTIGIGRNLENKGITEVEAIFLLQNDLTECEADLEDIFPNWPNLGEVRQKALLDMRFNLGHGGFRTFSNMILAVLGEDFEKAALEMKNSRWFGQVGPRAETLYDMMLTGKK